MQFEADGRRIHKRPKFHKQTAEKRNVKRENTSFWDDPRELVRCIAQRVGAGLGVQGQPFAFQPPAFTTRPVMPLAVSPFVAWQRDKGGQGCGQPAPPNKIHEVGKKGTVADPSAFPRKPE